MSRERYDELVSVAIDGEPNEAQLMELQQVLAGDHALAREFQLQLKLWDLWSQESAPERSVAAFLEGFHTRLRAEEDGDAFQRTFSRKRRTLVWRPVLGLAAALVLLLGGFQVLRSGDGLVENPTVLAASQHVCIEGECVCTVCTLHRDGRHQEAVRYEDAAGDEHVILLASSSMPDGCMGKFCGGPTLATIEGEMVELAGQPYLAAANISFR